MNLRSSKGSTVTEATLKGGLPTVLPPPRDAHTLPCTLQRRTLPLKTDYAHRSSAGLVQAHALHACTPSDQLRRDVIVQTMVARIGMRKKIVECGCTPPADERSCHCRVPIASRKFPYGPCDYSGHRGCAGLCMPPSSKPCQKLPKFPARRLPVAAPALR